MLELGYKLMSEEHGPADLVRNAKRAEQAGFEFAAISDHFSPWLDEQGHAFRFPLGDFLALLAGFRQADGDRLLATLHFPAAATLAALEGAVLALAHGTLDALGSAT